MRKEHERLGIELSAPNLIMDVERQRRGPKMQFLLSLHYFTNNEMQTTFI